MRPGYIELELYLLAEFLNLLVSIRNQAHEKLHWGGLQVTHTTVRQGIGASRLLCGKAWWLFQIVKMTQNIPKS